MKQLMQSKANNPFRVNAEGLVSSTKGTTGNIEIFRCSLKQFLTKISMRQQKDDFNPKLLTESANSGMSCYQAELPGNNRVSVKLPVKGQYWLKAISRINSPGNVYGMADEASRGGLEHKTCDWNAGSMNSYPEVKLFGFLHCNGETELRKLSASITTSPDRAGMAERSADENDRLPVGRIAGKQHVTFIKSSVRNSINHFNLIAQSPSEAQTHDKLFSRWQNHLRLNRLVESLLKLEYSCEADDSTVKVSQLILCQS